MNKYHVTFYYLATGMEGRADQRDFGMFAADSSLEALDLAVAIHFPGVSAGDRSFLLGCMSARLVH